MASAFSLIHSGARPTAGNLVDVIAQAAFFDHLGQHGQDAGVVHAGAHVQHRRDADRLADFAQPRPDLVQPGFAQQQAELGAGDRAAAGLDHQHILLEQLLGDIGVQIQSCLLRGLLQPTMAATPRMRPDMMASFSGRKEAR